MQHDAPYIALEKQNRDQWKKQDADTDKKLNELHKTKKKRPNIVFILTDDMGYFDVGCFGGGKIRGAPTPHIDQMAAEGMKFLNFYSEPSCTPSRVALMTGRYPVRTGLTEVLWPGSTAGLHPEEVTIATLLSNAGYSTGFFGKWHLGDEIEHQPQSHGFDEAFFTLYNAAPFVWEDGKGKWFEWPEDPTFREKYPITGILEAKKGKKPKEVEKLSTERLKTYEHTLTEKTIDFIKRHAKSDKPFFAYFAASRIDYFGAHPDWEGKSWGKTMVGDQMMEHDHNIGRVLQTIRDLGIADNTLVVWMSDNGPMYFAGIESSGNSPFRGGKGDVLEGGVRGPAIAWWPGTIKPGQDPIDIISITDMFTTAARLGGVRDKIPDDRITDGVDQTSFLLKGEFNSRRDYAFFYSGADLAAFRKRHYKIHIGGMHGGLPMNHIYNIYADPREEHLTLLRYMSMAVPAQDFISAHMQRVKEFPHRVLKRTPGTGLIVHD